MSRGVTARNLEGISLPDIIVAQDAARIVVAGDPERLQKIRGYYGFADPAKEREGKIALMEENFLTPQKSDEVCSLDEIVNSDISDILGEIELHIIAETNNQQDDETLKRQNFCEAVYNLLAHKIAEIFNNSQALAEQGRTQLQPGEFLSDRSWFDRLYIKIYNETLNGFAPENFANLKILVATILRATSFSAKNHDGNYKNAEDIALGFAQFSTAADLRDCAGGSITALNDYYAGIRFSPTIWGEVKSKMARQLNSSIYRGSQVHVGPWLDFIATGAIPQDQSFITAGYQVPLFEISRVIESIMLRGGNLVVNNLKEKFFEIFTQINHEDETKALIAQKNWEEYEGHFAGRIFAILEARKSEFACYFAVTQISKVMVILQNIAAENKGSAPKSKIFEALEDFFDEVQLDGGDDTKILKTSQIPSWQNSRDLIGAKLIIAVNSYVAADMRLPVWFRNILINHFGLKVTLSQVQARNADEYFSAVEKIIAEKLDFVAQDLSQKLKIPLRVLGMEGGLLKFHRYIPTSTGYEFDKAVENLQNALNTGEDYETLCSCFQSYLDQFNLLPPRQKEQFNKKFSIEGILLHPSFQEIYRNLILSSGDLFHFNPETIKAVKLGDHNYFAARLYTVQDYFDQLFTVNRRGVKAMPDISFGVFDFMVKSLSSSMVGHMNSVVTKGQKRDTVFNHFLKSEDDKVKFLNSIAQNYSLEAFAKIITDAITASVDKDNDLSVVKNLTMHCALNDSQNNCYGVFKKLLDEVCLLRLEEKEFSAVVNLMGDVGVELFHKARYPDAFEFLSFAADFGHAESQMAVSEFLSTNLYQQIDLEKSLERIEEFAGLANQDEDFGIYGKLPSSFYIKKFTAQAEAMVRGGYICNNLCEQNLANLQKARNFYTKARDDIEKVQTRSSDQVALQILSEFLNQELVGIETKIVGLQAAPGSDVQALHASKSQTQSTSRTS